MSAKHLSPEMLNQRRLEAVRLRLDGLTVASTAKRTGLSAPTVSAAWKAFREGGWQAVPVRPRGRHKGNTQTLGESEREYLWQRISRWPANNSPGWTSRELAEALSDETGQKVSQRAVEHWLEARNLKPAPMSLETATKRSRKGRWLHQQVQPVLERVRSLGGTHWLGGVRVVTNSNDRQAPCYQLYVHGKHGVLHTCRFATPPKAKDYIELFKRLAEQGPTALIFHGAFFKASAEITTWLEQHTDFQLLGVPPNSKL
ncbi:Transposase [Onishia taeanensis]|uniref:Transposase n=1 Tax=Onishia taeanensis TaxID=284577 RepID=A0A1G7QKL6_9GAMM|nr:helix-turn-helix domain-containing protein [Halomonas taeanensis]SDF99063.1 Transposase [Halomonas taeanensis]